MGNQMGGCERECFLWPDFVGTLGLMWLEFLSLSGIEGRILFWQFGANSIELGA